MPSFLVGSQALSGRTLNRLVSVACSVAFVLFGYEQGVMGGVLTGSAFTKQFPTINTTTASGNSTLQGFVVAVYNIGCWSGALVAMLIGERLGRKGTIILGASVIALGTVLQCSSFGIPQLIAVTGMGNGLITSTIPVWHAELVKAASRGKLLTTELSTNVGGVAVAYWIDYGFSYVESSAQWRAPIAFQIAFALATIALLVFLPETPRWLLSHDHVEEALEVLQRLSPHLGPEGIDRERLQIVAAITQERMAQEQLGGRSALRMVFTNGEQRILYRTMLGVGIMIMQQLTGINLITYYAPYIFIKSVGLSQRLSSLMAGVLSLVYYLSTLIPIFIIDRVGRRPLLLGGLVGMGSFMFVLAGCVSVVGFATGVAATVALFLYDICFGVGWIPGPWLITPEYAPLITRAQSSALATSATWLFTFVVGMITPPAISHIGWRTYLIFGALNFCFIPAIFFFYPETKGKSLEQIDFLFSGPKVLIDLPMEELERMQQEEVDMTVAQELGGAKAAGQAVHVEAI